MRKIPIIAVSLIFSYAIAQTPLIKVRQVESNEQVNIVYDVVEDYIWGIQIPLEFQAIINMNDSLWISRAFHCANMKYTENFWSGIPMKAKFGEEYVSPLFWHPMKNHIGEEYVSPLFWYPQQSDTCHYLVLSRYYPNPDSSIQDCLSQYAKRMKEEGVTSLNVGTLSEFKIKHPKIVERILKNDSIGFDIRKLPREFMSFIAVPVEY